MPYLPHLDAVELAAFVCGYTETEEREAVVEKYWQGDEEELNDKLAQNFEDFSFETFWAVATALLPLTQPVTSLLAGNSFHAFIKHDEGLALAKIAVPENCANVKEDH